MIIKWSDLPDIGEAISREIEYQRRRGARPVAIEVSPEAHELMRLHARAPWGSILLEHDGLPVRVNKKMIGPRAWKIIYEHVAPVPERLIDAVRSSG